MAEKFFPPYYGMSHTQIVSAICCTFTETTPLDRYQPRQNQEILLTSIVLQNENMEIAEDIVSLQQAGREPISFYLHCYVRTVGLRSRTQRTTAPDTVYLWTVELDTPILIFPLTNWRLTSTMPNWCAFAHGKLRDLIDEKTGG